MVRWVVESVNSRRKSIGGGTVVAVRSRLLSLALLTAIVAKLSSDTFVELPTVDKGIPC